MKNDGTKSEATFEQMFKGKDSWVFKLTDTKSASRGGKIKVQVKKQPADYIVCNKGSMFFAEVKSCSNLTSFPFSNIKEGQWNAILRTCAAGTQYFVYIHNLNTDLWYIIPNFILKFLKEEGRASVKWEELNEFKHKG